MASGARAGSLQQLPLALIASSGVAGSGTCLTTRLVYDDD